MHMLQCACVAKCKKLHHTQYVLHIESYELYLTQCSLHITSYALHKILKPSIKKSLETFIQKSLKHKFNRNLWKLNLGNLSNMNYKSIKPNTEFSQLQKIDYINPCPRRPLPKRVKPLPMSHFHSGDGSSLTHCIMCIQRWKVAMLQSFNVTILQCYNVKMLQCHNITVLQCCKVAKSLKMHHGYGQTNRRSDEPTKGQVGFWSCCRS